MLEPMPTISRPPQAVLVQVQPKAVKLRRSSDEEAVTGTLLAKQPRKHSRSGTASRTLSAAKALKEKW